VMVKLLMFTAMTLLLLEGGGRVAFHFALRLVGLITMLRQRLGARWPAFRWFPVWPCHQGQPVKSSVLFKELGPVGPVFRGWEITSLIPCYLAASPVVYCRELLGDGVNLEN